MIPKKEAWSIVLVGYWNPMIFSPEWIKDKLTKEKDISIEIPINNPFLPVRFGFENLFLLVQADRLVLNPTVLQDNLLERLQEISKQIINLLPQTPMKAVGINFGFLEKEPNPKLLKNFNIADNKMFSNAGFTIDSTSIKRKLTINDLVINLTIQSTANEDITIDLNFHKDIKASDEAIDFLEKGIITFKNKAIGILVDIYNSSISLEREI